MKLLALEGGGDWYDASVEYLMIPDDISLEKEKKQWRDWYHDFYCPKCNTKESIEFISFTQWLKNRGAKDAGEDDIIVFHDD